MDTFPNSASAWLWWVVSVVVVGILINLISSFIYPRLEKRLAENSQKRRKILEEKEKQFREEVEKVKSDPVKVLDLKVEMTSSLLIGIVYAVILMVIDDVLVPFLHRIIWFLNWEFIDILIIAIVTFGTMVSIMVQWNKYRRIQTLLSAVYEK